MARSDSFFSFAEHTEYETVDFWVIRDTVPNSLKMLKSTRHMLDKTPLWLIRQWVKCNYFEKLILITP